MASNATTGEGEGEDHVPVFIEQEVTNPRGHRASYYAAAGDGSLLLDDARHGVFWQTLLAPRALYASTMHVLASTFLPVGYPHSVREEYLTYQAWDTVQALCSYLRGILTTKAILEGSGVGSEKASALSAAVNWVFRDGVGMTCSLFFSSMASTSFDGNIKEWRLFADVINDVGLTLDMLTSIFRERFLLLTCLSTVCKTMCGVAAGCTKSSITAHFAVRGNIADVAAKENAQETAVTLLGIVGGLLFARSIADPEAARPVFVFLTLLHVYANYKGVCALKLYSLNTQRAALLIGDFIDASAAAASNTRAYDLVPLLTPRAVQARERVWQPFFSWLRGDQPLMGARVSDFGATRADLDFLLQKVYSREQYAMGVSPVTGRVLVLFRHGAGPQDELKAFFQAQALRHLYPDFASLFRQEQAKAATATERKWPTPALAKALLKAYEMTVHRFPTFLQCLEAAGGVAKHISKAGGGDHHHHGGGGGGGGAVAGSPVKGRGAGASDGGQGGKEEEEEDEDEGWDLTRVNFGTRGWRLLPAEEVAAQADAAAKKHK